MSKFKTFWKEERFEKEFECPECGESFPTEAKLRSHYENAHPDPKHREQPMEASKAFKQNWAEMNKTKSPDKDFNLKWTQEGWRGVHEAIPKKGTNWLKVGETWVTGEWDDAGDHKGSIVKRKSEQFKSAVASKGGEARWVASPTSNVFSTGVDFFVRGIDQSEGQAIFNSIF